MDIKFDVDRIVELLKKELKVEDLQMQFAELRKRWIWDFRRKPDLLFKQFTECVKELIKILELVIIGVEKVAKSLEILDKDKGQKKLEAAIIFLDECLTLPFFLEPLDAPIFRILITLLVEKLNSFYGQNGWFVREK